MLTAGAAALVAYDPAADRQALESLAEWCGQFSPAVGVEDVAGGRVPDVGCHRAGPSVPRRNGPGGKRSSATLPSAGCMLAWPLPIRSERLGPWPTIAWRRETVPDLLRAKPTADRAGGCGRVGAFVLRDRSAGRSVAGVASAAGRSLATFGRSGRVAAPVGHRPRGPNRERLPRNEISSRLGTELLQRWDQAVGRLAEPTPTHAPPPEFRAGWSPEGPTARRDIIEAALQHLIEQVAAELALAGRGAVRLQCRFDFISSALGATAGLSSSAGNTVGQANRGARRFSSVGAPGPHPSRVAPVEVSIGLFEPSAAAKHLFELVQMQMERLRFPAPVAAVEVVATATAPLPVRQQEMFPGGDGSAREQWRRLSGLIDRLRSRLGRRSVASVRLVSDAQPEFAYRCDPLERWTTTFGVAVGGRRLRPNFPRVRCVCCVARRRCPACRNTSDVPPAAFSFAGRQHQVACTWGPERIETGWWRGRTIGRDYFRVETAAGHRYWLFRRSARRPLVLARDLRVSPPVGARCGWGTARPIGTSAVFAIAIACGLGYRNRMARGTWKGTGPCFRPTVFPQNTSSRRKMDQSPSRPSPSRPMNGYEACTRHD